MSYIPHTVDDIKSMLQAIGVSSVDELFADIPAAVRLNSLLNMPPALSEPELVQCMKELAGKNRVVPPESSFLGAGANRHYIPSIINHLLSRSEFYTAYTPYQPEISQGTLQSIFEFQSLICYLTGMEVANASMYDGASASAEAALMALRLSRKKKILVSQGLHPSYRIVLDTYLRHQDAELVTLPVSEVGSVSFEHLDEQCNNDTAALIVQYPNFFGVASDFRAHAELLHRHKAILIAVVTEPVSLGILASPGAMGADIVAGEGQSFGIPLQYGGPYVGFMATRQENVRQMPGRIVGQTVDSDGRRGFVLTLSTREQHIRREKATSNICTNQGLLALAATIAMAVLGRTGLRKLAEMNLSKAEYAKTKLLENPDLHLPFKSPTFNEFVLETPHDATQLLDYLREQDFLGGVALSQFYPDRKRQLLLSVTEVNSRAEIDRLASTIARFAA